jgi:hypothetical protein
MSKLLQACIAFSGDVDTVATIALAAGSCSAVKLPKTCQKIWYKD